METANVTPLSLNLGYCSFIKVLDNNDILFTTNLNNGSIQKIAAGSSTPEIIASNLGSTPGAVEILNGEYYFTLSTATNGRVKKVSASGTISTIVDNLTEPTRLAFDNHGNFVLDNQQTIDGNQYRKYTLYDKSGNKIKDVTDDNGVLILSGMGRSNLVPLFIDSFNNLFFGHADDPEGTASINHCNPYIDGSQYGGYIYKIQLVKQ